MKAKPIDCFDPCKDFFVTIVEDHIVTAAMKLLEMATLSDVPSSKYVPQGEATWTQITEERKKIIDDISAAIVDSFVSLDYNTSTHNTPVTKDSM